MTAAADPIDTVLLDVNGTIVPTGSASLAHAVDSPDFASAVAELRARGIAVGLCSDSPLEQLRDLGQMLGLGQPGQFPVVAENGNVVAVGGVRVLAPFPARAAVRTTVARLARLLRLRQVDDVLAREFGGPVLPRGAWAFGANRRASVSVFAPAAFVTAAARFVVDSARRDQARLSVDCSPRQGFLGIHPYTPRTTGKRRALTSLASQGYRLLMVGDSIADWVPVTEGVRCAFVANATVPAAVRRAAWWVSARPELEGVVEVLHRVLELSRSGRPRR